MNLDRIDILLLALLFLQAHVLVLLSNNVGFTTFKLASQFTNLPSLCAVGLFLLGCLSVLQGIQKTIEAYFTTTEDRLTAAKGAGYALLLSSFLFTALFAVVRTYL